MIFEKGLVVVSAVKSTVSSGGLHEQPQARQACYINSYVLSEAPLSEANSVDELACVGHS